MNKCLYCQQENGHLAPTCPSAQSEKMSALEAELAVRDEALRVLLKHAEHETWCPEVVNGVTPCGCYLSSIRREGVKP